MLVCRPRLHSTEKTLSHSIAHHAAARNVDAREALVSVLNSVDAGFVPSIKRSGYVAITPDLVRAPSTVSVAPEHFVSSTVVKVSTSHAVNIGSVRFTSAVTNVRSGRRRDS